MKDLFFSIIRNAVSFAGAVLVSFSALLFVVLFGLELTGYQAGPYTGMITFLVLPAIFVLGLIIIPIGFWWERARRRKRGGDAKFPVIDFNSPRTRGVLFAVAFLTMVNIAIVSVGTYKGLEVMHSAQFCGATCHTPMEPEYVAFKESPHASIACADCHVGEGVKHFFSSKMNGARQAVLFMFGNFSRPIATPVHNLRAANETCGHCHAPKTFKPDKLKVYRQYEEDEKNTEKVSVLMMTTGGLKDGKWVGNHWHANPENKIRFLSDPTRKQVFSVERTLDDGRVKRFDKNASTAPASSEWRTMDCTDCHNRIGHEFKRPGEAIDDAISRGEISRELPFVKREAQRILGEAPKQGAEGPKFVAEQLKAFYEKEHPAICKDQAPAIEQAGKALGAIYTRNVFPAMQIGFDTYPSNLNHDGCYRCHDKEHVATDGSKIGQKCSSCHQTVTEDEENPEVLEVLYP